MNRFFNSVVLITLAFSLALVSCTQEVKTSDFENLKSEVEALNNQLKATDIDYKTQITTLRFIFESYKNDVTPQLVALNEQMKADYEVLAAADILFAQQVEEAQASLQAAIDQDAEDIAANKKAIEAAVTEYKKLVADAIKGYEAAIAKAREDQASVDGVQDEFLATLASQMDTYKEAFPVPSMTWLPRWRRLRVPLRILLLPSQSWRRKWTPTWRLPSLTPTPWKLR